jgi:O-antigen/teichoic acid export membrane protein
VVLSYEINVETFLESFVLLYVFIICIIIFYSFLIVKGRIVEITPSEQKEFNSVALKRTFSISYAILASWVERLVLGILSPTLLAVFSIAYMIPKMLKDNVKVLLKPTVFTWINLGKAEYLLKLKKYSIFLILVGILVVVVLNVLIYPFVKYIYPKYIDSILFTQFLSIQILFVFYIYVISNYLIYFNFSNGFNMIANKSNSLKIFLSMLLIPLFGINGAVFALLSTELFRQYSIYHYFKKECL